MTLTEAFARFGLFAMATPSQPKLTGPASIGDGDLMQEWADADIAYAFKVLATGDGDVATLTLSTGAVVQTTGAPTITNGAGNDFEGVTLPTMVTLYGLQVRAKGTESFVQVAGSLAKIPDMDELEHDNSLVFISKDGIAVGAGTIALTLDADTDFAEVIVIGKSS